MELVNKETTKEKGYNYRNNQAMKITEEFKSKYIIRIKDKEAITCEGLKALAHYKGIKSLMVNITQYPTQSNDNMCIAEAKLIGYGWDPVRCVITEVEFSEIGDASPKNCSSMVSSAFIRMAATRATGRVLRNYTNIGMACVEEIFDVSEDAGQKISPTIINALNCYVATKQIKQEDVINILREKFKTSNPRLLTKEQGEELIDIIDKRISENNK